jgi:iron complex transport system ATP-binding protein
MFKLERINVSAGARRLVNDVSVSVEPGRVTALIGPNGAGKSTLMRVATGEHEPDSGGVFLNGRSLNRWSAREQAKIRAVVSQHSTLSFPFPVLDVVLMGRSPHLRGSESAHDVAIAWAAMEMVGVSHLAEQSYTTLSGGERQRVDLARALSQIWEAPEKESRYLFLDEPTSSLDLAHQHEALRVAKSVSQHGVGVLVVLHDLNLAAQYADHIVMLCEGRCLARGLPAEVLVPDLIERAYAVSVMVTAHPCQDCPLIVPMTVDPTTQRPN